MIKSHTNPHVFVVENSRCESGLPVDRRKRKHLSVEVRLLTSPTFTYSSQYNAESVFCKFTADYPPILTTSHDIGRTWNSITHLPGSLKKCPGIQFLIIAANKAQAKNSDEPIPSLRNWFHHVMKLMRWGFYGPRKQQPRQNDYFTFNVSGFH